MRKIAFALLLLTQEASADWVASEKQDPITDKLEKMAFSADTSREIAVSFRRNAAGEVWGTIMSTKKSLLLISNEMVPIIRLDKHQAKPVVPDSYKKLEEMTGKTFYSWTPSAVRFLFWHGTDSDGISERILNLVNAEKMQVRVFEATGGAKDFEINMTGAKDALCTSLDLSDDYCAQ